MIKVVFALGANGAFGYKQSLPWPHNKQDLANFKSETTGHTLVMGAATFMSLPKTLPGRVHVVVEAQPGDIRNKAGERPHMVFHGPLENALAELSASELGDKIAAIGGIGIIEKAIPIADEIVMTRFNGEFDHDVAFPESVYKWVWQCREFIGSTIYNDFSVYRFKKYDSRNS